MIEQITDYEKNLDLFLQQWKNSPNLTGIADLTMQQGNKIEAALFEVRDLMTLEDSTGEALDFIGKIFGVLRENRSDDDYRTAIKQKSGTFFSGEPEVVISIMKSQYGGTYVSYTPEYPGKYRVRSDSTIEQTELDGISMAGVTGFRSGFLIDEEGNNIISFAGFLTNSILSEAGDNIIDEEGNNIAFPIGNVPGDKIIHVDG